MQFENEKARKAHRGAGQISDSHWRLYFNYEWQPIHAALINSTTFMNFKDYEWPETTNADFIKTLIICLLMQNKPVNPLFLQNFVHRYPQSRTFLFGFCSELGHLGALRILKKEQEESSELQAMIKAYSFYAFRVAAENGHTEVLKLLKEWAPSELQAMIKADGFYAFRWAAENGHTEVLKLLKEWAPSELQAMIIADDFYAFRWAAINRHDDTLKFLINSKGIISMLLASESTQSGQNSMLAIIESNYPLSGGFDFQKHFSFLRLNEDAYNELKKIAGDGNRHAQYLLIKFDIHARKNPPESLLQLRWLAECGHKGAKTDIKQYSQWGDPVFQCIDYVMNDNDDALANTLISNKQARDFFLEQEFDFVTRAVDGGSVPVYIDKTLSMLDLMGDKLACQAADNHSNPECLAWLYCARVLLQIQASSSDRGSNQKLFANNPIHALTLNRKDRNELFSMLYCHWNCHRDQWNQVQRQVFIHLIVSLTVSQSDAKDNHPQLLVDEKSVSDFNRVLVSHICGNDYLCKRPEVNGEQQLKLIGMAGQGQLMCGEALNEQLGVVISVPKQTQLAAVSSSHNFFTMLPDNAREQVRQYCIGVEHNISRIQKP